MQQRSISTRITVKIAPKKNAAKNGITEERLYSACSRHSSTRRRVAVAAQQYDLVLANIVADVIIALAPFARSVIKPGGTFITSGIILERKADVTGALRQLALPYKPFVTNANGACYGNWLIKFKNSPP